MIPPVCHYVEVKDYNIAARAEVAHGGGSPDRAEVLVLVMDNALYYLVAMRGKDSMQATIWNTFDFKLDQASVIEAYRGALMTMIRLAMEY